MQLALSGLVLPKVVSIFATVALLTFILRMRRMAPLYVLLIWPATLMHEVTHWFVGWLAGARPTRLSIWPKRLGTRSIRLGYVSFANARQFNGGAAALAPLLLIPALLSLYRFVLPVNLSLVNIGVYSFVMAWLFEGAWPSRTDWRLALQCWPGSLLFLPLLLLLIALVVPVPSFVHAF